MVWCYGVSTTLPTSNRAGGKVVVCPVLLILHFQMKFVEHLLQSQTVPLLLLLNSPYVAPTHQMVSELKKHIEIGSCILHFLK